MLHFLYKMSIHIHISQLLNNKSNFFRVNQLILMLLPPHFMPEFLPRRMRELSIDHARKSSHVDFLDKCTKYARILREFRANFVGLCVDLNPCRASHADANHWTFTETVLYKHSSCQILSSEQDFFLDSLYCSTIISVISPGYMRFSQWTIRNYNEHAKKEQPDLDAQSDSVHFLILSTSHGSSQTTAS